MASPQTLKNIKSNPHICIDFIGILVKKGIQIKEKLEIVNESNTEFEAMKNILLQMMTKGKFPFASITKTNIERSKPIITPKYIV
jgi:hypothetical protein